MRTQGNQQSARGEAYRREPAATAGQAGHFRDAGRSDPAPVATLTRRTPKKTTVVETPAASENEPYQLPGRTPIRSLAGPPPRHDLAAVIRQRIETRLGERIHDLYVELRGESIVLEGTCATYYSKQLAQHAALGVMEDENLDNRIRVTLCE